MDTLYDLRQEIIERVENLPLEQLITILDLLCEYKAKEPRRIIKRIIKRKSK